MAKPAYSLIYVLLIAAGLLALVLFNRLLGSDEASPAAQASLQRNEATARETRDAVADDAGKSGPAERGDHAEPIAGRPGAAAVRPPATLAEAPAAAIAKDEEERK